VVETLWGLWSRAASEWWADRRGVVFATASKSHAEAQWRRVCLYETTLHAEPQWQVKQMDGPSPYEVK